MAARKKSTSTQIKELTARAEKAEADCKSAKQHQEWAANRATAAEKELADVHAFLDAVPNPPADKTGEYNSKLSAMTRLSVYLATR